MSRGWVYWGYVRGGGEYVQGGMSRGWICPGEGVDIPGGIVHPTAGKLAVRILLDAFLITMCLFQVLALTRASVVLQIVLKGLDYEY